MKIVNEWQFVPGDRAASIAFHHKDVELEIDEDELEVRVDEGHGYGAYSTVARIPMHVLWRLLGTVPTSGIGKNSATHDKSNDGDAK